MELNRVDFNKIAVFCQVIESGNYQRASEVLGVTPSALSQSISSLEASMGIRLFDRVGKKLIPTRSGLTIHREFRLHQSGFMRSIEEIAGTAKRVSGVLRVGAYLEFAKARLSRPVMEFTREFPDTQIKMVFDTPTRLQDLLAKGQLDLCFSIFPSRETKMIDSRPVFHEELVLAASPGDLRDNPSFDDVMSAPIIEYYFNHQPIRKWLSLHFQKRPGKIPVRIFASTAEMVLSLIREGAGIGIVPLYLVANADVEKSVRIVRPTAKRFMDHIWLLERNGVEKSQAHAAFRERFLERKQDH